MKLVIMLPTVKEANDWLKEQAAGHFNYCTEPSGYCYIYQYYDDYVKANPERFTTRPRIIVSDGILTLQASEFRKDSVV